MLTATPRTAISTKDASFDSVWGQNSLVLLCFMFSLHLDRKGTTKMIWDFENGTSNFVSKEASMGKKHARLCFIPICQCVPEILHFERFFFTCLTRHRLGGGSDPTPPSVFPE